MSTVAILAALSAAASWAIASVSISRLLEHGYVAPAAANLFKNGLAAFCFFVAALTLGGSWPVGEAWGWLFLSGFLGFTVADTLYFAAFRRCGVQTAATVLLLNVPIALVLAVPLAGDAIQTQMLPFMAVVLVGVVLVVLDARHGRGGDPSPGRQRSSYAIGVALAM
ncbi:MAG: EamA family transporter [Planctomycetota bacterium]